MKYFDEKIKKFDSWDYSLIKLATMAFALMLFKAIKIWGWDAFSVSIWWWLVIFILLAIKPAVKVFGGEKKGEIKEPPAPMGQ